MSLQSREKFYDRVELVNGVDPKRYIAMSDAITKLNVVRRALESADFREEHYSGIEEFMHGKIIKVGGIIKPLAIGFEDKEDGSLSRFWVFTPYKHYWMRAQIYGFRDGYQYKSRGNGYPYTLQEVIDRDLYTPDYIVDEQVRKINKMSSQAFDFVVESGFPKAG